MKNFPHAVLATASAGLCLFLSSQAQALDLRGIGSFEAAFGGDTMIEVTYTDGSKSDIDAGRGLSVSLGLALGLAEELGMPLELQTSVGYKYTSIAEAEDGGMTWSHMPVDALVLYRVNRIQAGLGVTYHMANKMQGDGLLKPLSYDAEDAQGLVVQGGYVLNDQITLFGRYTSIEYVREGTSAAIDGSNLGVGITGTF